MTLPIHWCRAVSLGDIHGLTSDTNIHDLTQFLTDA